MRSCMPGRRGGARRTCDHHPAFAHLQDSPAGSVDDDHRDWKSEGVLNPVTPTTFRSSGFQRRFTCRAMSVVTLRTPSFARLPPVGFEIRHVPSASSALNAFLRGQFVLSPNGATVYTIDLDQNGGIVTTTAKLFKNGRSQAVRLPREFRFDGDRVRVRRAGRGVLVEPIVTDVAEWFAELDRLASEPFMSEGRQQPPTPERDVFE